MWDIGKFQIQFFSNGKLKILACVHCFYHVLAYFLVNIYVIRIRVRICLLFCNTCLNLLNTSVGHSRDGSCFNSFLFCVLYENFTIIVYHKYNTNTCLNNRIQCSNDIPIESNMVYMQ